MTATNTVTNDSSKRSVSVPREVQDGRGGEIKAVTKRRQSVTGSLGAAHQQHLTSPWCNKATTTSSAVVSLTPFQQSLVTQLEKKASAPMVALVGPHGSGKTLLVQHFLQNRQQEQKRTVLWLQADSEATLRASYVAVLRQYAPATTSTMNASGGLLVLAHLIKQTLQSSTQQQQQQRQWLIVYHNVTVDPMEFFSQRAIPTLHFPSMLTTTLESYATWQLQQPGDFDSIQIPSAWPTEDAKLLFGMTDKAQSVTPYNNQEGLALDQLLHLLQHHPLAITTALGQWRQMDCLLKDFVTLLQHYKDNYKSSSTATINDPLEWLWDFAIDQVWDNNSYNVNGIERTDSTQAYRQKVLQAVALLHHECIPYALLQQWEIALPELQQWHVLHKACLGDRISYSIPIPLQKAIQRRHDVTPKPIVKALQSCFSVTKDAKVPVDVISLLPHVETLMMSDHVINKRHASEFPQTALADVLLQAGVTWQRPPLQDYAKSIQTYRQGLEVLGMMDSSTTNSQKSVKVAKALYYRLATCARLQDDFQQAKQYSLQALALYGYQNLSPSSSSSSNNNNKGSASLELPTLHHNKENVQPGDWNMLSQLFHICGHACWQDHQVAHARLYFEYELAVKKAWYGNQSHERVARALNNLGSICRDGGDLMAARDYSLQSLEMQQQLNNGANSLETSTTLNNLGSLSYSLCEYVQAQGFFEQALAMKQACYREQQANDDDPIRNLDVGETYYNLGMLADHLSNYDKAQRHYLEALECKYAVYGKDSQNVDLAATLSALGLSAMNYGQYEKSEQYYQKALAMQKAFYHDEGNMETVRTLHGLGILNYHLGKLQKSRDYHREALAMQQEIEAKERRTSRSKSALSDPRIANLSQIMQNLGNLAHNIGEYDNARDFYEQGLKLYSQVSVDQKKEDHLKIMLGSLESLSATASYDAARSYYEKALEMKHFVYGEDAQNSDLAFTLRSLALLNDNAGRHKEAQVCYEKALKMLHHIYGSEDAENSEIAGILDGLGTVSFNQGKYNESGVYFAKALAMKETVYGGKKAMNGDLATSHASLGTLAHTKGNYNDAVFHLEKAFEMQLAVFGDDGEQNIELGVTSNLLANLYRDLGMTEKALAMYERSLQFMREDNPFLASVLTDMGEFYRQQGDYEKANACLERAMTLHKKLYGEDAENAEIAFTLLSLGKLNIDQSNYDEAEKNLNRALKMQQDAAQIADGMKPEGTHGEMAETLQALGSLMLAKGDNESAKKYLEQSMDLSGDVNTRERALAVRSLGHVYTALNEEEKAQACQEKLLAMTQASPAILKVLDDTPAYRPVIPVESQAEVTCPRNNPVAITASLGGKPGSLGKNDMAIRDPQLGAKEQGSTIGDRDSAKKYQEQTMALPEDINTGERDLAVSSVDHVYAPLIKEEKAQACEEKPLPIRQHFPGIDKTLSDNPVESLTTFESQAAVDAAQRTPEALAASLGGKSSPADKVEFTRGDPQQVPKEQESRMQEHHSSDECDEVGGNEHQAVSGHTTGNPQPSMHETGRVEEDDADVKTASSNSYPDGRQDFPSTVSRREAGHQIGGVDSEKEVSGRVEEPKNIVPVEDSPSDDPRTGASWWCQNVDHGEIVEPAFQSQQANGSLADDSCSAMSVPILSEKTANERTKPLPLTATDSEREVSGGGVEPENQEIANSIVPVEDSPSGDPGTGASWWSQNVDPGEIVESAVLPQQANGSTADDSCSATSEPMLSEKTANERTKPLPLTSTENSLLEEDTYGQPDEDAATERTKNEDVANDEGAATEGTRDEGATKDEGGTIEGTRDEDAGTDGTRDEDAATEGTKHKSPRSQDEAVVTIPNTSDEGCHEQEIANQSLSPTKGMEAGEKEGGVKNAAPESSSTVRLSDVESESDFFENKDGFTEVHTSNSGELAEPKEAMHANEEELAASQGSHDSSKQLGSESGRSLLTDGNEVPMKDESRQDKHGQAGEVKSKARKEEKPQMDWTNKKKVKRESMRQQQQKKKDGGADENQKTDKRSKLLAKGGESTKTGREKQEKESEKSGAKVDKKGDQQDTSKQLAHAKPTSQKMQSARKLGQTVAKTSTSKSGETARKADSKPEQRREGEPERKDAGNAGPTVVGKKSNIEEEKTTGSAKPPVDVNKSGDVEPAVAAISSTSNPTKAVEVTKTQDERAESVATSETEVSASVGDMATSEGDKSESKSNEEHLHEDTTPGSDEERNVRDPDSPADKSAPAETEEDTNEATTESAKGNVKVAEDVEEAEPLKNETNENQPGTESEEGDIDDHKGGQQDAIPKGELPRNLATDDKIVETDQTPGDSEQPSGEPSEQSPNSDAKELKSDPEKGKSPEITKKTKKPKKKQVETTKKEDEKKVKVERTDRSLVSVEKPVDPPKAIKSDGRETKKQQSIPKDISDMPARRQEPVETTCGCWPFGRRK